MFVFEMNHETKILTGEQNSSNAGFTKYIYWFNTWSRSLPLSFMSLGTRTRKASMSWSS